jgi:aminocarboxymuconate-semialdehyde decarboxylase
LFGAWEATECGLKFFGPERVLFASDSPFDPEKGSMYTRTTIEIVDRLDVSPEERHAIYEGNARRLLKLTMTGTPAKEKPRWMSANATTRD